MNLTVVGAGITGVVASIRAARQGVNTFGRGRIHAWKGKGWTYTTHYVIF